MRPQKLSSAPLPLLATDPNNLKGELNTFYLFFLAMYLRMEVELPSSPPNGRGRGPVYRSYLEPRVRST